MVRPRFPLLVALWAVALALADAALAGASDRVVVERSDLAPRPDSRRYVGLGELAGQFGAQDLLDELTGLYVLRRGGRTVSVVPGVAAALVGSELVLLDEDPVVRYGQAYLPRSLLSRIRRLFGAARETPTPVPPTPPRPPRVIGRICIDPGHGGRQPGATSPWGLEEKGLDLLVAQALAAELRERGFEAVLTREGDTFVELEDRPAIAARRRADLFLSIHANSLDDRSKHGAEIFYPDGRGCAAPEAVRRESIELAEAIRNAFASAGLTVRSVRAGPYRVLRLAAMPAVLVEIGFLTNLTEERLLRTSAYRQRVARAIAGGVVLYRRK